MGILNSYTITLMFRGKPHLLFKCLTFHKPKCWKKVDGSFEMELIFLTFMSCVWISPSLLSLKCLYAYPKLSTNDISLLCFRRKSHTCVLVQSLLTLFDPVVCNASGSSVHGILQARILERVAISFSRVSSQPRDWTQVSCIGRQTLYHWANREASLCICNKSNI